MFGKKKKRAKTRIRVLSDSGEVLFSADAAEFKPPEKVILELSVEFFSDPEPCEIHRSAVCLRAVSELQEALKINETAEIASLPERLRRFFSENAQTVCIEEEC